MQSLLSKWEYNNSPALCPAKMRIIYWDLAAGGYRRRIGELKPGRLITVTFDLKKSAEKDSHK
jgi:hypothetical protein